jgi:hypothetical protein
VEAEEEFASEVQERRSLAWKFKAIGNRKKLMIPAPLVKLSFLKSVIPPLVSIRKLVINGPRLF